MSAPETWRVVLEQPESGERVEVTPSVERYAGAAEERIAGCDLGWTAHGAAPFGDFRGYGPAPRSAVLDWLQGTYGWVPVEILAPGEPTRAELIAECDAAIARAVAEERAACARVAESLLDTSCGTAVAALDDCAAAIRARGGAR